MNLGFRQAKDEYAGTFFKAQNVRARVRIIVDFYFDRFIYQPGHSIGPVFDLRRRRVTTLRG
jgi:hypothetical protein